jgi:hypothetical protein
MSISTWLNIRSIVLMLKCLSIGFVVIYPLLLLKFWPDYQNNRLPFEYVKYGLHWNYVLYGALWSFIGTLIGVILMVLVGIIKLEY